MKWTRLVLLMAVLAFAGAMVGCQECQEISGGCQKAYEENSAMYDYVGSMPPECLSESQQ